MNFDIIQPAPQLADYVKFFWFTEGNASLDKPFAHHAFAYTCPELIFCYKGQFIFQIACESGYHDESHLIHDFQKFSGSNPKEYFKPGILAASDRGTVQF